MGRAERWSWVWLAAGIVACNWGLFIWAIQTGHAVQASHLGKGILERDLEVRYPDKSAEIVMYCGGGYRSALTCDAAQKMGYQNVRSIIGGYKGLVAAGWPMTR